MEPRIISKDKKHHEEMRRRNIARDFATHLKVFSNHNGLRRNKMHLMIAPTGVGKSTFARTMIIDFLENNCESKILLWLTEETIQDFEQEFVFGLPEGLNTENLTIISEQELLESEGPEEIKRDISELVDFYNFDLVVCDNITTSRLYTAKGIESENKAALWLKSLCKRNLALFIIAHTGAGVVENTNKLIDENDIRGSKMLTTLVEFLYVFQPMYVGGTLYQFINFKKHRGQPIASKYLQLIYNHETRIFRKQKYIEFEFLKSIFKTRNTLHGQ